MLIVRLFSKPAKLLKDVSAILCLVLFCINASNAQDKNISLHLELNGAQQIEESCRITFLAQNKLTVPIKQLSLETVLIDAGGSVERFTLFDFQSLPIDKPRVRQFDLPQLSCKNISRVLINGAETCDGDNLDGNKCIELLDVRSRISIELLG